MKMPHRQPAYSAVGTYSIPTSQDGKQLGVYKCKVSHSSSNDVTQHRPMAGIRLSEANLSRWATDH